MGPWRVLGAIKRRIRFALPQRAAADWAGREEPVRAFAACEEATLCALQVRMEGDGMHFDADAFARLPDEQRERTALALALIDGQ